MIEQWQELKETIIELRDNNGTGTPQQEVCKFLANYMDILEKQMQEPKTEQFARWVATEIFDENWEYNKDAFAELACRKLAKLGIVRAKDDKWELVEPQESEESEEISDRNMKMWEEIFKAEREGMIWNS